MMKRRSSYRAVAVATALALAAGGMAVSITLAGTASATDVRPLAASAGCGQAPGLTSGNRSIQSGGQNRSYILRIPDNYDRNHAYRLIFAFHWNGGTANDVDSGGTSGYPWSYYGLRALSNNSTIFVAPQGNGNGWANPGGQDLRFVDDMVNLFKSGLCVDTSQLFSMGFSYGGGMSFAIACARSTVFRAVAIYSGGQLSGCDGGTQPIAYIGIHGLRDNVLPISTGRSLRDRFVRNNGCTPQNPPEPAQGSLTHIVTYYSGCRAGYPVAWGAFDGPHAPNAVDGSADPYAPGERSWTRPVVWDFFTQFGTTPPPTSAPPTTVPPTTAPPTTAPPTTTPPVTEQPGACTATFRLVNGWPGGFQGEVTVTNNRSSALNGWTTRMTLAGGQALGNIWGGVNTGTSGAVAVRNAAYNGTVGANASTSFGFIVNGSSNTAPSSLSCTSP